MTIVSAEPGNQMGTPPDLPGVAVNSPPEPRTNRRSAHRTRQPPRTARTPREGLCARWDDEHHDPPWWGHGGDDRRGAGRRTELVEEMAAEIAAERRLPPDWLGRLIIENQPPPRSHLATMCERSILIVVRTAAHLAARCVGVARQAQASRPQETRSARWHQGTALIVKLVRRLPSG